MECVRYPLARKAKVLGCDNRQRRASVSVVLKELMIPFGMGLLVCFAVLGLLFALMLVVFAFVLAVDK